MAAFGRQKLSHSSMLPLVSHDVDFLLPNMCHPPPPYLEFQTPNDPADVYWGKCSLSSRRGSVQEDKRMVLEYTHGLFIT